MITDLDQRDDPEQLDERLVQARSIMVIVRYRDHAHVAVNLTTRRWESWAYSDGLDKRLAELKAYLKSIAVPQVFGSSLWLGVALAAFLSMCIVIGVADAVDPSFTTSAEADPGESSDFADMPGWARVALLIATPLLLAGGFVAALFLVAELAAGGFRALPRALTADALRRTSYDFRRRNFTGRAFDRVAWLIVTVAVTAVVTKLLS
ncbi:hypothetical protein V6V47_03720 [Micromonospora sp. CPCC 205539]|uniref:hypothetical protein n=1 Tax=Micromonospora sp. CPCC 205539 TaxID=3122408 RepID=UPI002FF19155